MLHSPENCLVSSFSANHVAPFWLSPKNLKIISGRLRNTTECYANWRLGDSQNIVGGVATGATKGYVASFLMNVSTGGYDCLSFSVSM